MKEPQAACCFRLFSWGTYAKMSLTGAGSAGSAHELRAGAGDHGRAEVIREEA